MTELFSNIPELSVSELAFSLKRTLEESYGRVRVRGELSRVKFHSSGHMYSALKDDQAVIDLVCWRGTVSGLSVRPEEGLEVICTGKITTYPARSNYQMVVESMELAGEGALLKMLEERRRKLAGEGLFDEARKRPLPFLPKTIAVITSPTGAVIRDIMHRISDRFPCPVLLFPVRVQGETAATEIIDALREVERLYRGGTKPVSGPGIVPGTDLSRPDVLIIARGGGSLEDLMPFNDERLVRAVSACTIPIISAVGHETDTTLIDYAADYRAPTPTGAAERAVPRRADLILGVQDFGRRLYGVLSREIERRKQILAQMAGRIGSPARLFEIRAQRLDHAGERLGGGFERRLSLSWRALENSGARLRHPRQVLQDGQTRLQYLAAALGDRGKRILPDRRQAVAEHERMLDALSFNAVLARGYAVVRNKETGALLNGPQESRQAGRIALQFHDFRYIDADIQGDPYEKGT